jgi:hypothetical protein
MATNFLQKVLASADAATGLVSAANGAVQRVTGDSLGRLWARVFGDTPHDSPDNTNPQANYPVKIGGRAAATNAGFAAVATDDRTDAAFDVNGRLIVNVGAGSITPTGVQQVEGNVASGAADSGNPVKVGAIAATNGSPGAAVTNGQRSNFVSNLNGMQHVVTAENPLTDATTAVWTTAAAAAGNGTGQIAFKASPGRLRRIIAINNDALNTLYLQIHNTTAVGTIATGTLRWPAITIPPGGVAEVDFNTGPLAMTSGICAALSTTQTTYTAAAVTGQFGAQFA